MPVQSDSIIYCINYTKNPGRNRIYSHIFSIMPGKGSNQRTSDKVENEATIEQTKEQVTKSKMKQQLNKPRPVLT